MKLVCSHFTELFWLVPHIKLLHDFEWSAWVRWTTLMILLWCLCILFEATGTFFKIYWFVFHRSKCIIQIWNDMTIQVQWIKIAVASSCTFCNTFKVKCPVSVHKSAFSFNWKRWTWIWQHLISVVVAFITAVQKLNVWCTALKG